MVLRAAFHAKIHERHIALLRHWMKEVKYHFQIIKVFFIEKQTGIANLDFRSAVDPNISAQEAWVNFRDQVLMNSFGNIGFCVE